MRTVSAFLLYVFLLNNAFTQLIQPESNNERRLDSTIGEFFDQNRSIGEPANKTFYQYHDNGEVAVIDHESESISSFSQRTTIYQRQSQEIYSREGILIEQLINSVRLDGQTGELIDSTWQKIRYNDYGLQIAEIWAQLKIYNGEAYFSRTKHITSYDTLGKIQEEIDSTWIIDQEVWEPQSKSTYTYDSIHHKLVQKENDIWDGRWVQDLKWDYVYDNNERKVEDLYYEVFGFPWTEDSPWTLVNKVEYSYDSIENKMTSFTFGWNYDFYEVRLNGKQEYTYDSRGNTLSHTQFELYDTANFTPTFKSKYGYNSDDQVIRNEFHKWDTNTSEFVNFRKWEYHFDAQGYKTFESFFQRETNIEPLVLINKRVWTYDADHNLLARLVCFTDEQTGEFKIAHKGEYTYDAIGRMINYIGYELDRETDKIVPSFRNDYVYFFEGNKTIFTGMEWDKQTKEWKNASKTTAYYTIEFPTSLVPQNEFQFQVFPNPASNFIMVKTGNLERPVTLELFEMTGKKIITKEIVGSIQLPVSHLPTGIYVGKFTYQGQSMTTKVQIRK